MINLKNCSQWESLCTMWCVSVCLSANIDA